jgi:hypothetical protein
MDKSRKNRNKRSGSHIIIKDIYDDDNSWYKENNWHWIKSESTVKNLKVTYLQGPLRNWEWGGQKKRYKMMIMMMKGCWEGHHGDQSYVWILMHGIFYSASLVVFVCSAQYVSLSVSSWNALLSPSRSTYQCEACPGRCIPLLLPPYREDFI